MNSGLGQSVTAETGRRSAYLIDINFVTEPGSTFKHCRWALGITDVPQPLGGKIPRLPHVWRRSIAKS
jgi:hypothetical protein